MNTFKYVPSSAFQVARLSALNSEEGCEVFTGLLLQELGRFTYKNVVGLWG